MTAPRPEPTWRPFLRVGGWAALVYVVMVLVPLAVLVTVPVPPDRGAELLPYIADHKLAYLVQLVCFVGLSVPALLVFAALSVALAGVSRSLAGLGGLLGITSEGVALAVGSSPQSLHGGLVVLSNSYTSATTDAERAGLESAADALIAATNATPWAGIITAAAIGVLSWAMWRSPFGRALAVAGVLTGVLGVVSETLRPMLGLGYLLYGLMLPLWFAWVGGTLLRLARGGDQRPRRRGTR